MHAHLPRAVSAVVALALFAVAVPAADKSADKDIAEIAVGNKDFSTLVTALKAADLVEVLKGEGPFTVFAPTNEAFAKVGEEKIKALLADKKTLTKILKAHVVAGKAVMAKDVAKMEMVKPLEGEFKVTVDGKNVRIGKAKVIKANIKAKNGVIHVIDTVLIPE